MLLLARALEESDRDGLLVSARERGRAGETVRDARRRKLSGVSQYRQSLRISK